jgi:hypothetical protein
MGMFADIIAKIFPSSHPAVAAAQAQAAPGTQATPTSPQSPAAAPPAASAPPVDVEAVIAAMPGASSLNWKTSIVDLLKVLGLESSLDARKRLASDLGYAGSTSDSAAMNVWLHREVVAKLAANGGKLPADMKA